MWEKDLLSQAEALRDGLNEEEPSPELEQWLRQRTQRARLVAFLGRHDPLKLIQASEKTKNIFTGGQINTSRTYGTHNKLYISLFLLVIFGPIYYGPS